MAEAKTKSELLKTARARVPEVTPGELAKELQGRRPVVLDVREKDETDQGILPGSKLVPRGYLELRIEEAVPDRDSDVVLYCAGGTRSLLAGRTLQDMGYKKVRSLRGGYGAWKAAGVGRLGIVDDDVVDESNLQRQVIHDTERVGVPKTESARETIRKLNPDVTVDEHRVRLNRDNALELFRPYDLIVDGSDNFGTRYLVNDACVLLGKPNVHGSIFRFDGQATTFIPGDNRPCYRCLFPEPPPAELAPSCQEAGVLGVLPGVIGLIQAVEAVKVILGKGEPLVGRLLLYDALEQRFREVKYERDRECP